MSTYPTVDLLKMKSASTVVSHRVPVVEEAAEQVAVAECQVDAITNPRELAAQIKRTLKNKHS